MKRQRETYDDISSDKGLRTSIASDRGRSRRVIRIGSIVLAILMLPAALILTVAAFLDAGFGTGFLERNASALLHRDVRLQGLEVRLLTSRPRLSVSRLVIGNPAWLRGGHVAIADRVTVRFRLRALLIGRIRIDELRIGRLNLDLRRFGPGRNNWSISSGGSGPAFAPLLRVDRLDIADGTILFRDTRRDLIFRGRMRHRSDRPLALAIDGGGMLRAGAIRLQALGGPLNGASVGQPYPFTARLSDGGTLVAARGTSGEPFNMARYALHVRAHGPNLADIGYIFSLITPNTGSYRLSAKAFSDGKHLRFDALDLHTGASHVTGRIWSDHSGSRREIRAVFRAPVLTRAEILALLQPVPSRNAARSVSGAVPPSPPSRWILSDSPISLRRMRGADFDFKVLIDRLEGYPLPLRNVRTRIDLDHGLLDFPSFSAGLLGGRLTGAASLDARTTVPTFQVRGGLAQADLRMLPVASANGTLDARFDLSGTGHSFHEAAGNAQGMGAISLDQARIPRRAAWMLGGDLLRAALSGRGEGAQLDCMDAMLQGQNGRLDLTRFALMTPLGSASGHGHVDLGAEAIDVVLHGQPARRRLFQVAAPVRIAGPWLKPAVTILPGKDARALGLRGALGVALTPLAALLPLGKDHPAKARCVSR